MKNITEQAKKAALAVAFGAVMNGSIVTGIPSNVPGLSRALTCPSCTMKLSGKLPAQFTQYMTNEQKEKFRQSIKRRNQE